MKYGVTQNLTADLTINTDFAQVEVDEQQVNLTRFNLFFPEKRDFFLEGLGIFAFAGRASAGLAAGSGDTPYLFFSRRIGLDGGRETPLRAGGRLTGKVGGVDGRPAERADGRIDARPPRVEPANFTVLRAKRDILRRSSIGGDVHPSHRARRGASDRTTATASTRRSPSTRTSASTPISPRTRTEGTDGRRSQLSRLLRLQRRSLRPAGGTARGRAQLPPGDRLPAPHRHAAQLRRMARFSPRPATSRARAEVRDAGEPQLRRPTTRIGSTPARSSATFQTELVNSDVATRQLHRQLRSARPDRSTSRPASASRSARTTFTRCSVSYAGGQQRKSVGDDRVRDRHVSTAAIGSRLA